MQEAVEDSFEQGSQQDSLVRTVNILGRNPTAAHNSITTTLYSWWSFPTVRPKTILSPIVYALAVNEARLLFNLTVIRFGWFSPRSPHARSADWLARDLIPVEQVRQFLLPMCRPSADVEGSLAHKWPTFVVCDALLHRSMRDVLQGQGRAAAFPW